MSLAMFWMFCARLSMCSAQEALLLVRRDGRDEEADPQRGAQVRGIVPSASTASGPRTGTPKIETGHGREHEQHVEEADRDEGGHLPDEQHERLHRRDEHLLEVHLALARTGPWR